MATSTLPTSHDLPPEPSPPTSVIVASPSEPFHETTTHMNISEVRAVAADPVARRARYRQMVAGFYTAVTDAFEAEWGDSQHCGLFATPETPVGEAAAVLERLIATRAGISAGMRVLDVGSGLGGPARHIARVSGARITGVDLTTARVRLATARMTDPADTARVSFLPADATALPFRDHAFDVVYTFEMAAHLPDKAAFFRERARVLRPGGVFAGTDWFYTEGLDTALIARYIEPICRLVSIPALTSVGELRATLATAGFHVTEAGDLAAHGDVTPNFTLVGARVAADLARADELDPTTRLLAEGGRALGDAYAAGAFLMGYWIATKG